MGGRRADAPRDAIEKGRVAGDRARVEQREQEFRVVDFELGEVGHLPDLMADREARIPQRMQDGAHAFLFGFLDLAVEQEQDVDVRVQTQLTPTVAAERDDEAGDGRARCFSEQPFEEFVDAVRKAPKGRASALAARGSRRQVLSRSLHDGARRRHVLQRTCHMCVCLCDGSRQRRAAHQVRIDSARAAPAVGDRPDDERLAALHVAGRENARHVRHPVPIAGDRAARGELDPQSVDDAVRFGSEESHREQHEISVELDRLLRVERDGV